MTVSSTTNRKTFTGDAVTTSFGTSPVVFFDTDDLDVYVVVTATGVATLLTKNTHYTVSGGDGSTGTVSLAGGSSPYGAPAATETLVIVRNLDITQEADPENNDGSDANVIERALDRLTMIAQQISALVNRSLRQPESDASDIAALPNAVDRASMYLGFDSDGDPVALAAPAGTTAVSAAWATAIGTAGSVPTFPDAVNFANGSAAAPSIAFASDPDTGIYRAAANQVALAAGGVVVGRGAYASGTGKSFSLDASASGEYAEIGASHSSNTASSQALLSATVAGGTAGDPYAKFVITGGTSWALGADNSDSDSFVVSRSTTLGTNNALRVDATGAIQTGGTAAAATGYAANGDITLPATGVIRALNASKAHGLATISAGVPTLVGGFNVSSVTDTGTGRVTFNLTNAMTTNYASLATVHRTADAAYAAQISAYTTSAITTRIVDTSTGNASDSYDAVSFAAFGA